MDRDRAQKIIDSPVMINVNYHGVPIYIKELLEEKDMAKIFPLEEMDNEQVVDINGLREHQF